MATHNQIQPKAEFDYVLRKARSLLILRSLGELRRPAEMLFGFVNKLPGLPGYPSPGQIKNMIDELTRTIDMSLHEVIIVTCVTALEVYLEAVYENRIGKKWMRAKLENRSALEHWAKSLNTTISSNIDPFRDVPATQLQHIFQIRHVIVHRGGVIDEAAIRNGLGFEGQSAGRKIEEFLDFGVTEQYLRNIEDLVHSVQRQLL